MLFSLALIFTIGLILGEILGKIGLPKFIGMIITGVILGPDVFDLINIKILDISSELRTIALVIILIRAGLSLDTSDLKKIGRPAILMSFIPAMCEIAIITVIAPLLFDISYLDAALLGSVIAAVSPAVIVPKMIKLIDSKWGNRKRVPHLILASASVDDVIVIVIFSSLIEMSLQGGLDISAIYLIPVAIVLGIIIGIIGGYILSVLFSKLRVRDTIKVLIIMAVSFFILALESAVDHIIPFSGLLSVMLIGITFLNQSKERAIRLRKKFEGVWVFAELVLFVLVGAAVNLSVAIDAGLLALLILLLSVSIRMIGVQISLIKSDLNMKERLFTSIAFTPKATVQAAIGAIPKTLGLPGGDLILALAVLSIIITAPLGATGIELTYKKLLEKKDPYIQ